MIRIPPNVQTRRSGSDSLIEMVGRLFGWACVFHFLSGKYDIGALEQAVLLFSVIAIWLPGRNSLAFLCAAQLCNAALTMTAGSNHWLLAGGLSCITLGWLFCFSRGGLSPFLQSVRLLTLVCYFFAVFHKLNWDFFNPKLSCAVYLAAHASIGTLLEHHPALARAVPIVVLGIEGFIFWTLAARAPSRLGYFVAILFHGFLGIIPGAFFDFSSLLSLLFLLCALSRVDSDAIARLPLSPHRGSALVVSLLLSVGAMLGMGGNLTDSDVRVVFGLAAWPFFVVLVLRLASAILRTRAPMSSKAFIAPTPIAMVVPAIFLLNNASIYMGLKTEQIFSIYSNLEVSGCRTNHILLPRTACTLDFLEPVTIISVSNPRLYYSLPRSQDVSRFEMYRVLSLNSSSSVQYSHHGTTAMLTGSDISHPWVFRILALAVRIPVGFTHRFEACHMENWRGAKGVPNVFEF